MHVTPHHLTKYFKVLCSWLPIIWQSVRINVMLRKAFKMRYFLKIIHYYFPRPHVFITGHPLSGDPSSEAPKHRFRPPAPRRTDTGLHWGHSGCNPVLLVPGPHPAAGPPCTLQPLEAASSETLNPELRRSGWLYVIRMQRHLLPPPTPPAQAFVDETCIVSIVSAHSVITSPHHAHMPPSLLSI